MYTAMNPLGRLVHISSLFEDASELQLLKQKQGYLCPFCSREMLIKGGTASVKAHFSHKARFSCTVFRGETKEHKEAKELLYYWLAVNGHHPEMETVLPAAAGQRADIFFYLQGRPAVLEIQRSQLSAAEFVKRHTAYAQAGIEAFWIGIAAGQNIVAKVNLTVLASLRLRSVPFQHSFSIDLDNRQMRMDYGYVQLHPSKALHTSVSISLRHAPEAVLLPDKMPELPYKYFQLLDREWEKGGRRKRLQKKVNLTSLEETVIPYYWNHRLNLNYYPALCYLPVVNAAGIKAGAEVWQSWILFRFVQEKGDYISASHMSDAVMAEEHFSWLPTSMHPKNVVRHAVLEYCSMLAYAGALQRIYPGVFKVVHPLTIKKTRETLLQDDVYIRALMKKYFECKNN